jgi:hypothetical protein
MKVYSQFEHLPAGHRLARSIFVAQGAAYDVEVQFDKPLNPSLRKKANGVLRLLRSAIPRSKS